MANKVTVLLGQSLVDLCLQTTGSIDGLFAFVLHNGLSITDTPEAGSSLKTIDGNTDKRIHGYYAAHHVRPATGINTMALPTQPEGIGYWFIENDFIVQ